MLPSGARRKSTLLPGTIPKRSRTTVPIMAAMMMVVSSRDLMKVFTALRAMLAVGWGATAVIAFAAVAMIAL